MVLSNSQFNKIRELLYSRTGIQIKESKIEFLSRKVYLRMKEIDIESVDDYIRYLVFDKTGMEQEDFVDLVVINETYFFRDYQLMRFFGEEILPIMVKEKGSKRNISILSAGCSTGDEPYTLAIILREMLDDVSEWNLRIDAADISRKVLDTARKGLYTSHALREIPELYRNRYFEKTGESYQLVPALIGMVNFRRVNLFDPLQMAALYRYDVVFCRNVLIYFDSESRTRVLEHLYDAMNPSGFIFLGPGEGIGRMGALFDFQRYGRSFAYRKNLPK